MKSPQIILVTLIAYGVYTLIDQFCFKALYQSLYQFIEIKWISFFTTYLFIGVPLFLGAIYMHKRKWIESFGLNKPLLFAFLISLIASLPMLIGNGILSGFQFDISFQDFIIGCVCAALFEELYYRGFFFGQLFRYTRLGFFPSIIVGALIFGGAHLYQSNDFNTSIGVFAITFMGAGLFAWLYAEWDYNLWVPIGLHFFMNLSWEVYNVADNALGGVWPNIFRVMTIVIAIVGTIRYKKKKGLPMEVHRQTLWMK